MNVGIIVKCMKILCKKFKNQLMKILLIMKINVFKTKIYVIIFKNLVSKVKSKFKKKKKISLDYNLTIQSIITSFKPNQV